ncbi:polysaccharide biosynthesis tyrosine autokinase [Corynebacterium uterequi]|uniref:non-specific protein-tyrosine kinase n=1 Tax=Corynebacterium uterequi TaxID=1072256 RepID=A0A0G3HGK5_9CORY|nr:polysaccharide biosynthesis tyrosine autokinase [Corynebacterium uterequi]AKK11890.1 capsular exopolysaccharide biosynthesis protein [Corynebacterium uterequi]
MTHDRSRAFLVLGVVAVLGGYAVILGRGFIFPLRFDLDALTIAELIDHPYLLTLREFGSYADIARFYSALGIGSNSQLAGMVNYSLYCLTLALAYVRARSAGASLVTPIMLGVAAALGAVFLGTHTKEVLVVVIVLVVLAAPKGGFFEVLLISAMALFGALVRPYWLLVAGAYVVVRLVLTRTRPIPAVLVAIPLCILGASLAWYVVMGTAPDANRTSVNLYREFSANARTLIPRYVEFPEPVGGTVNNLLVGAFLLVPLPLAGLGTVYHLAAAALILTLWGSMAWAMSAYDGRTMPPFVARATALIFAFIAIQAMFEPDFGSALRHLTPMLPLMSLVVADSYAHRRHLRSPHPHRTIAKAGLSMSAPLASSYHPDPAANPGGAPRGVGGHPGGVRVAPDAGLLPRLLKAVGKSVWVIVVCTLLGGALAWGAASFAPKKYTASSEVFVSFDQEIESGQLYQQAMFLQTRLSTYAGFVTSDDLTKQVAERFLGLTAQDIQRQVEAKPLPETVLLSIQATDTDPERARGIAEAVNEELVDMVEALDFTLVEDTDAPLTYDPITGQAVEPEPVSRPLVSLTVISAPELPREPSSPQPLVWIVLGALAGLVLCVLVVVLRALVDRTIKDRAGLEQVTGAPLLGLVPVSKRLAADEIPDYETDSGAAAESFRAIRTSLRFVNVDNPPRTISITSATQSEGKSTLAMNLASALAAEGLNICLVDADLRRPSVAERLGVSIEQNVGVSTVISGECGVDDAIQRYHARSLDVIASGVLPPNPAELLASRACREFLDELAQRYDHVIVDSTPLLAVTDGALLASQVDGSIVVVRHGDTTDDELRNALTAVEAVGATVLGMVLSAVPTQKSSASHYGTYASERKE